MLHNRGSHGRHPRAAPARAIVGLLALVVLLDVGPVASQGPTSPGSAPLPLTAKLTLQVSPEATFRRRPLVLTSVVEAAPNLSGAQLVLDLPPGLRVATMTPPDSLRSKFPPATAGVGTSKVSTSLPTFSGSLTLSYLLVGTGVDVDRGQYPLNVRLTRDSAGMTAVLATSTSTLTLQPEQSLAAYLGLGALGILVGYLLRLLIKVLSVTPAPAAQPIKDGAPVLGPIGRLVAAHYYKVDCLVTVVLGLAALLILVREGHLPDNGAGWYGALLLGLGLGLLTNSELITKLR